MSPCKRSLDVKIAREDRSASKVVARWSLARLHENKRFSSVPVWYIYMQALLASWSLVQILGRVIHVWSLVGATAESLFPRLIPFRY